MLQVLFDFDLFSYIIYSVTL